eukprot:CAMPEP_0198690466 /NCGR_PEP_ID=MMETSP1468-20131203/175549_1 /TAXON_ID=1461545 /ORGANISM="Mantoniella sp, Strain CCMP1436" /LENGTH=30 /DNA_ID= /DNA_START= /DNA_END= /DNA_ORIENTATION=
MSVDGRRDGVAQATNRGLHVGPLRAQDLPV